MPTTTTTRTTTTAADGAVRSRVDVSMAGFIRGLFGCVVYLLAEFIQTQLVRHDNRFIAAAVKMRDRSRFTAKQKTLPEQGFFISGCGW